MSAILFTVHPQVVDPPLELRDPSDQHIIETAIAAQAQLIVTSDRDLLSLHKIGEISIVDLRDFKYYFSGSQR